MTFSAQIKSELSSLSPNARHCNIAEILSIINTIGHIRTIGSKSYLWIQTENVYVIKKFEKLFVETYNIPYEIMLKSSKKNPNRTYYMLITNDELNSLFKSIGIKFENDICKKEINSLITNLSCCKRAYIRGSFLSGGSLTNPEKSYHIEFLNHNEELSKSLQNIINSFGLNSKLVKRKGQYVIYLKDGEQITDLLNIMEAHNALLEWENVRVIKDVRNSLNRSVNCETANIGKVTSASVKQVEDIMLIENTKGFEYLSEPLEEIARLRLENQDVSLKEIGEMLNPPVGKSGVNHRFRKISEIARNIRGGLL